MHNTGNPIGSRDILDLYDNSEAIDQYVNSQEDSFPDRFGTKRLTLAGLIKRSMALRNEINDFSGALTFRPEWSDVPMNVSEGVGGEGGALNLQAEALGNRTEINKITSREALRRTYQEVGLNLVEGSFEQGAVITSTTDVVLHEKTGKCYSGPIGQVPKGTDPLSGNFVDRDGCLVNAFITTYMQGRVSDELDSAPSPIAFGGVPGGLVDASGAIMKLLALHRSINLRGRVWKISSTIILPDGCSIDMRGADIIADTGTDPLFQCGIGGKGVYIQHGGGVISGTASAFIKALGETSTPTNVSQYARNIKLFGLYISSPTFDWFIDAVDAVRQVFIDSCYAFTKNGIRAIGKCVEWKVNKSIMFSSVTDDETRGLVVRSPNGGNWYNEGWHFTDCTLDNFEKNEIDDIYVFTWNGGYLGTKTVFGQPTTTHCREIVIGKGSVLSAAVEFSPDTSYDYRASIEPAMFTGVSGNCVLAGNGACGISVDTKFVSSGDNATCVRLVGNNSNCHVTAIADATYERLVSFEGVYGPRCSYLIKGYMGGSNPVYTEHPVRCISQPVSNSVSVEQTQLFTNTSGTFAVGDVMSSITTSLHKGAKGSVILSVSMTGGNVDANPQLVVVTVPAGMVIPAGTGWSSANIRPRFAHGFLYVEIPFYCNTDISEGSLKLTNAAGNTINIDYHGYFGYRLL